MSGVVEIANDLSSTLTKHLRLMASDESKKELVDRIEKDLGTFFGQRSVAPLKQRRRSSISSTKAILAEPASTTVNEWGRRSKRDNDKVAITHVFIVIPLPHCLVGTLLERYRPCAQFFPLEYKK